MKARVAKNAIKVALGFSHWYESAMAIIREQRSSYAQEIVEHGVIVWHECQSSVS